MNFMNMRPVLFATVLMTSTWLAAAPPSARNLPELMPAPESALQHAGEIGLTEEQQARLKSEVRELEMAVQKLNEQVRRESGVLAELLAQGTLDQAGVAAQFEKVLAAENEVKRVRLQMSMRTRAVLSAEQQDRLASLQMRPARNRTVPPEQQELAAQMERVKELIVRAKAEGRDLSAMREMWKRVDQLTREGKTVEAIRVLNETAQGLEASRTAPSPRK